jgi:hypothetical protein
MNNLLAFLVYMGIAGGFAANINDRAILVIGHGEPATAIVQGLLWPMWLGDALGHYALFSVKEHSQ